MGMEHRWDGLVRLSCDVCARFLKPDGRRSVLPARLTPTTDVQSTFAAEEQVTALAAEHDWERRGRHWLCGRCAAEATL